VLVESYDGMKEPLEATDEVRIVREVVVPSVTATLPHFPPLRI